MEIRGRSFSALGLGAGVVGCVVIAQACSSRFSDCETARTCSATNSDAGETSAAGHAEGPGGQAGEAGSPSGGGSAGATPEEGGAGGDGGQPDCTKDTDCSDGIACNGLERCEHGACVPGAPPCSNPDADHCAVTCSEVKGAASCVVSGEDKDGDGHVSTACKAAHGDDCDDSNATVYPHAPELCDGIDHDCNGKIGVDDGLPLSGKAMPIGLDSSQRDNPMIAWAPDQSVYGIGYRDSSTTYTYFETVQPSGETVLKPVELGGGDNGSDHALAWSGGSFAVLWSQVGHLFVGQTITANGIVSQLDGVAPADNTGQLTSADAVKTIVPTHGGDFAILSTWLGNFFGTTTKSQAVQPYAQIAIPKGAQYKDPVTFAAVGDSFVIGSATAGGDAFITLYDSSFKNPTAIDARGKSLLAANGAGGFAVVATQAADSGKAPEFSVFDGSGKKRCGPVPFADKTFMPAAVVGSDAGYLVLSSGQLKAQFILPDCTVSSAFVVDSGVSDQDVRVAVGAAGYGVVWQDGTTQMPKFRAFGPHFCD